MEFDLPKHETSIIKVLGVGGGGSNAVSNMYDQGIVGVDFAVCNTDAQALEANKVPLKIQLGSQLTGGRGAGSKPLVGKESAIESLDEVKEFLSNGAKMLFITAGMGGGTGTGAAPVIAKLAREMNILTVGIVTLPFTFEGRKRTSQGIDGLEELKTNVDTLIVISNDKLRQIHGDLPITSAFAQADDILTTAARGIAEIITVPGYVNVDFEDVNTVMRESGVAIMGTAETSGEGRARKAVDAALNSPLLEDSDIKGAQHILINITSGNEEVTMDEIFEITEYVQEEAGFGTDLIWGNCYEESLGDKISVTIIATGFEDTNSKKVKDRVKRVTIGTSKPPANALDKVFEKGFIVGESTNTVEFDSVISNKRNDGSYSYDEPYVNAEELERREQEETRRLQEEKEYKERCRAEVAKRKLTNPQNVVDLENEPAYLRRKVNLDNVPAADDIPKSRYSISFEEEPEIKENTFLHDNVD